MTNKLWVYFAIIGGFTGFLLGYSVPPIMEVGLSEAPGEIGAAEGQESPEDEDLAEYYKQLQELQK